MPFERTVNLSDPMMAAMVCDLVRNEQGERVVSVKEPTRSQAQNRRYWIAIVEPLAQWLSSTEGQTYSKDDVHYLLKKNFLPLVERLDPFTGAVEMIPMSTTKLTKSDFSTLCEKGQMLLDKLRDERKSQFNRRSLIAGK